MFYPRKPTYTHHDQILTACTGGEHGPWLEQMQRAGAHLRRIVDGANLGVRRGTIQPARRHSTKARTSNKFQGHIWGQGNCTNSGSNSQATANRSWRRQSFAAGPWAPWRWRWHPLTASETGTWAVQNRIMQRNPIITSHINTTNNHDKSSSVETMPDVRQRETCTS
jgi:hypothetical protein